MSARNGEIPSTQTTLLLRLQHDGAAREIAWREFHGNYGPVIAGFARRMGARPGEIDDVVQAVMVGFYGAVSEFRYDRTKGRFRGYLKTCTWRKLEEVIAKRLRTLEPALTAHLVAESEIDAAWEQAWQQARLVQATDMVRDRYSRRADQRKTFAAFEHCMMLGRAPEEVATDLQMTIEQVYQAKSRIQRALRETIKAMDDFAD